MNYYTRKFYLEYYESKILQQLVVEIPWGHNVLIMQKIKDSNERQFYLDSVVKFGWTR